MADEGFEQPSRVGPVVGEVLNAYTVIENPRNGLCKSEIRNASVDYAIGELLWYLSGSNKLSSIVPYSKAWNNLSDDGETCNSSYGYRIHHKYNFDQWDHCKELLTKDELSRQAIIHIKDPNFEPSKDVPCTIALQYQIREDRFGYPNDLCPAGSELKKRLYATTYMRSNDIWLGVPYDFFTFTSFQVKMAMELGVELGTYTHVASSLHLYKRDYDKVKEAKDAGPAQT